MIAKRLTAGEELSDAHSVKKRCHSRTPKTIPATVLMATCGDALALSWGSTRLIIAMMTEGYAQGDKCASLQVSATLAYYICGIRAQLRCKLRVRKA